jgi:hypothetical protein
LIQGSQHFLHGWIGLKPRSPELHFFCGDINSSRALPELAPGCCPGYPFSGGFHGINRRGDIALGVLNDFRDLSRCHGGFFSQLAHLTRHHGKAAALFPRPAASMAALGK